MRAENVYVREGLEGVRGQVLQAERRLGTHSLPPPFLPPSLPPALPPSLSQDPVRGIHCNCSNVF